MIIESTIAIIVVWIIQNERMTCDASQNSLPPLVSSKVELDEVGVPGGADAASRVELDVQLQLASIVLGVEVEQVVEAFEEPSHRLAFVDVFSSLLSVVAKVVEVDFLAPLLIAIHVQPPYRRSIMRIGENLEEAILPQPHHHISIRSSQGYI